MAIQVKTVLCVPVPFAERTEVVEAVAGVKGNGHPAVLIAGDLIVEDATGDVLELEIDEHDDALRLAFERAAPYSTLTDEDFEAIDRHGLCLYLIDDKGGSIEAARRAIRFGQALLASGGLAVKVDSTGKAHSKADWQRYVDRTSHDEWVSLDALLDAFVVLVATTGGGGQTCGMHNLGLPDVEAAASVDGDDLGRLLWSFARYLLIEEPELDDDHTFSLAPDAPLFRLERGPCEFPADSLVYNPFGVWHLLPTG